MDDGPSVVLTAAVVALVGILLLRFPESRLDGALCVWILLAVAVAVGSLLGPLGPLGPLGATSAPALIALHALVATVVGVGARRTRWALGAS